MVFRTFLQIFAAWARKQFKYIRTIQNASLARGSPFSTLMLVMLQSEKIAAVSAGHLEHFQRPHLRLRPAARAILGALKCLQNGN